MDFEVIQGGIAARSADCLVNAAGTSLQTGSGVAGALRRGANGPINEAAMDKGPVELGEVAVTEAFDLDADYVFHAAAMPHYGDGQATEASIRSATRNSVGRAEEPGCESMVIPALGCGVAGFDLAEGDRIISEAIAEFESETLSDVRFIGYSEEEFGTISHVAVAVRGDA